MHHFFQPRNYLFLEGANLTSDLFSYQEIILQVYRREVQANWTYQVWSAPDSDRLGELVPAPPLSQFHHTTAACFPPPYLFHLL